MALKMKEKLKRGEPITVINPDHASPTLYEFLGKLGFDATFTDCELQPATWETVDSVRRAAHLAGMDTIVRPDDSESYVVARYVHRGIGGVMVPRIHTAEQAQRLVDTVSYAKRGDLSEFLIVAMIESLQGVENLDQILKVAGIDVFFVGPGDLSNGMKVRKNPMFDPKVQRVVQDTLKRIMDAGRVAGTTVAISDLPNGQNLASLRKQGVLYLYQHLNNLMTVVAQQYLLGMKDGKLGMKDGKR